MYGLCMRVLAALSLVSGAVGLCTVDQLQKCQLGFSTRELLVPYFDKLKLNQRCGALLDVRTCRAPLLRTCPENVVKLLEGEMALLQYLCDTSTKAEYLSVQGCLESQSSLHSAVIQCHNIFVVKLRSLARIDLFTLAKKDRSKACNYVNQRSSCMQDVVKLSCPLASSWYEGYEDIRNHALEKYYICDTDSNLWTIVGGVLGGIAGITIITIIVVYCCFCKRRGQPANTGLVLSPPPTSNNLAEPSPTVNPTYVP